MKIKEQRLSILKIYCLLLFFSMFFVQVSLAANPSSTLGGKNSSVVNVKQFGAKGDGTTDDTAAFAKVLTAIGTDDSDLYIPQGTYKITRSLTIPAYVGISLAEGAIFSVGSNVTITMDGNIKSGKVTKTGAGEVVYTSKVYNIKDYGSKDDYTGSLLKPLQDCINDIANNGGRGRIYFPDGIYKIQIDAQNPVVRIPSTITYLELLGSQNAVLKLGTGNKYNWIIVGSNCSNMVFNMHNLYVDGNSVNNPGNMGITPLGGNARQSLLNISCKSAIVEDCIFDNWAGVNLLEFWRDKDSVGDTYDIFKRNKVLNCGQDAEGTVHDASAFFAHVDNNTAKDVNHTVIAKANYFRGKDILWSNAFAAMELGGKHIIAENNDVDNFYIGIITAYQFTVDSLKINNNSINHCANGIVLWEGLHYQPKNDIASLSTNISNNSIFVSPAYWKTHKTYNFYKDDSNGFCPGTYCGVLFNGAIYGDIYNMTIDNNTINFDDTTAPICGAPNFNYAISINEVITDTVQSKRDLLLKNMIITKNKISNSLMGFINISNIPLIDGLSIADNEFRNCCSQGSDKKMINIYNNTRNNSSFKNIDIRNNFYEVNDGIKLNYGVFLGNRYNGTSQPISGVSFENNHYNIANAPTASMVCLNDPVTDMTNMTGIALSDASAVIKRGEYKQLTYTIAPNNATNKDVIWSSNDTKVATIDAAGKVTAVAVGTATITVKTIDGGKTATCSVTVTNPPVAVTGVTLNPATLSLTVGQTSTLVPAVAPSNATNKNVTWTTSNPTIVRVDATGKVTAVSAGTVAITVKTVDGNKTAACSVTVSSNPNVQYNVKDYGAKGDGVTDDTSAIQAAVNAASQNGGSIVNIPAGTYMVNALKSINMNSKVTLQMTSSTVLRAMPNNSGSYSIIKIEDKSNIKIKNGVIQGERKNHTGTTGEWGMGVSIAGCSDVSVEGTKVSDCWGDGFYIGSTAKQKYCENIKLIDITADNNRRQGISLISGRNIYITRAKLINTNGTAPAAGIDLEPNHPDEFIKNIEISNLHTEGNTGYGVLIALGNLNANSDSLSVSVVNPSNIGSKSLRVDLPYGVKGEIKVTNSNFKSETIKNNNQSKDLKLDVDGTVFVSGVAVNFSTLSLTKGQICTLAATLIPSDATNKNVTYTSSKPAVATVDATGKVTAVSVGTAAITVKTVDGNKTATCNVTVQAAPTNVAVTGVTLNPATLSLTVGQTSTLVPAVAPSNATNKNVTWTSSKPAVAIVDATGKVTAVVAGTATIAVITVDGKKAAACNVTVTNATIPVTGVTVNPTTLSLVVGQTGTITPTIAPTNATNKNVTYTSSKPAVATVDATGKVTAVSVGAAAITVKTVDGNKTATCNVTVQAAPTNVAVTGVTLNPATLSLTVGQTSTLVPAIAPSNATNKNVTWTTSNPTIVRVDATGKVTAVSAGTVAITVKTVDGNKTAACSITVRNSVIPVSGITVNHYTLNMAVGQTSTLTPTITPNNATNKAVTWTSSSTVVAAVYNGNVTAIGEGTAIITATTVDGRKTAACNVTVTNPPTPATGITMNPAALNLTVGQTGTLTATIVPSTATINNMTWTSSNTVVAAVYEGAVTAIGEGVAVITAATPDGGMSAECSVTVINPTIPVTGVIIAPTSLRLTVGEASTLTAGVLPDNATNKDVTWTSSDAAVATINDGTVTAVGEGTAVITVTTIDGQNIATCDVTVESESSHTQSSSGGGGSSSESTQEDTTAEINSIDSTNAADASQELINLISNNSDKLSDEGTKNQIAQKVKEIVDNATIIGQKNVNITQNDFTATIGLSAELTDAIDTTSKAVDDLKTCMTSNNLNEEAKQLKNKVIISGDKLNISEEKNIKLNIPNAVVEKAAEKAVDIAIENKGVKIIFKSTALPVEELKTNQGNFEISSSTLENTVADSSKTIIGKVHEFTANIADDNGAVKQTITRFKDKITVEINYTEDDIKNVSDLSKVGIYTLDEATGKWIYVKSKTDKENKKITFDALHFSKYAIMEYTKTFEDVKPDNWAKDYIEILAARQITEGVDENNFNPQGEVTRAQFATFIVKALGINEETYTGKFKDVKEGQWYTPYIEAAVKAGLAAGTDNNSFSPNAKISREEMAAMIMRAYNYATGKDINEEAQKSTSQFGDINVVSPWAKSAVLAAQANGIINGVTDTQFAPKQNAQRGQAAKMLVELLRTVEN